MYGKGKEVFQEYASRKKWFSLAFRSTHATSMKGCDKEFYDVDQVEEVIAFYYSKKPTYSYSSAKTELLLLGKLCTEEYCIFRITKDGSCPTCDGLNETDATLQVEASTSLIKSLLSEKDMKLLSLKTVKDTIAETIIDFIQTMEHYVDHKFLWLEKRDERKPVVLKLPQNILDLIRGKEIEAILISVYKKSGLDLEFQDGSIYIRELNWVAKSL